MVFCHGFAHGNELNHRHRALCPIHFAMKDLKIAHKVSATIRRRLNVIERCGCRLKRPSSKRTSVRLLFNQIEYSLRRRLVVFRNALLCGSARLSQPIYATDFLNHAAPLQNSPALTCALRCRANRCGSYASLHRRDCLWLPACPCSLISHCPPIDTNDCSGAGSLHLQDYPSSGVNDLHSEPTPPTPETLHAQGSHLDR